MRRREFITLLGGAVVWPRSVVAQQSSIPIIGFLTARSRNETTDNVAQFREGLREAGYREGETVSIEFRWASGEYDRLPVLAADLAQHRVAVIVTSGGNLSAQGTRSAGRIGQPNRARAAPVQHYSRAEESRRHDLCCCAATPVLRCNSWAAMPVLRRNRALQDRFSRCGRDRRPYR